MLEATQTLLVFKQIVYPASAGFNFTVRSRENPEDPQGLFEPSTLNRLRLCNNSASAGRELRDDEYALNVSS